MLVLASFRGPFAVRRLGSALRLFFSAIGFIFYLSGSQSWPPLKQDLEKTEAPRVAPLEVMTVGPVLPSCTPPDTGGGAQVFPDLEGPGVARAWVLSLLLLLAFRGGGQSKPLKEESSADLRATPPLPTLPPHLRTAGRLLGVDAGRQLGANSQPENILQDFQLSFFYPSSNE